MNPNSKGDWLWLPSNWLFEHNRPDAPFAKPALPDPDPSGHDVSAWSPLHWAAYHGRVQIAELLLDRADTDVAAVGMYNETALLVVAQRAADHPGDSKAVLTVDKFVEALAHRMGDDINRPDVDGTYYSIRKGYYLCDCSGSWV